jgi:hypothetical protein
LDGDDGPTANYHESREGVRRRVAFWLVVGLENGAFGWIHGCFVREKILEDFVRELPYL